MWALWNQIQLQIYLFVFYKSFIKRSSRRACHELHETKFVFDVSRDMPSKPGTDFFADRKPYAYYKLLVIKYHIDSDSLSKVKEMSSAFSLLSNKKMPKCLKYMTLVPE